MRSGEICPAITENGAGSISGSSAGAEKVFGKSSRYIIQHILDNPGQPFDVAPFIDRRCKYPAQEIQAAVDGAVSYEQAAKLKECLLHIDQLNEHREHIETELLWLAEPYPHQLELVRTVDPFVFPRFTSREVLRLFLSAFQKNLKNCIDNIMHIAYC